MSRVQPRQAKPQILSIIFKRVTGPCRQIAHEPVVRRYLCLLYQVALLLLLAQVLITAPSLEVTQAAELTAEDGLPEDLFGSAVALSTNTAVIGASEAGGRGCAYVYQREGITWAQQAKLLAPDGAADDRFGIAVSVSGDTIAIGASGDDDQGSDSGAVYIFTRSGDSWTFTDKLKATDGAESQGFGLSVSLSGDTVAIGTNGYRAQSAYVFISHGGNWQQQAKLESVDGVYFGSSVSLSGDTVVVGDQADELDEAAGAAYIFVRHGDQWTRQAKLTPADGAYEDWFGSSVSISGDTVVVGAENDDDLGSGSGSAYVFVRSGNIWLQQAKLLSPFGGGTDGFGHSVAIADDVIAVGQGIFSYDYVHLFTRDGNQWRWRTVFTPLEWGQAEYVVPVVSTSSQSVLIANAAFIGADEEGSPAYLYDLPMGPSVHAEPFTTDRRPVWTWQPTGIGTAPYRFATDKSELDTAVTTNATSYTPDSDLEDGEYTLYVQQKLPGDEWSWAGSATVTIYNIAPSAPVDADDTANAVKETAFVGNRVGITAASSGQVGYELVDDADGRFTIDASSGVVLVAKALDYETVISHSIAIRARDPAGNISDSVRFDVAVVDVEVEHAWKIYAADASMFYSFGNSVSMSSDMAVIGSDGDNESSVSAYIFTQENDEWVQETKLEVKNDGHDDYYGSSISVSGNTIVAGAVGSTSESAYVFVGQNGQWRRQARLTAPDGSIGDYFGHAVSVTGDTIVIGVPGDDDRGEDSGAAHLFVRMGSVWQAESKLLPEPDTDGALFGQALATTEHLIVIGAPAEANGGTERGSVSVFVRDGDTWTRQDRLSPADLVDHDRFGASISATKDTILVGAPGAAEQGNFTGSAYVYVRRDGTWLQQDKIVPQTRVEYDRFGTSVSISGDNILVGSQSDYGFLGGAAHAFRRTDDSWNQRFDSLHVFGPDEIRFGGPVSLFNETALIGVPDDDDKGPSAGAAYILDLTTDGQARVVRARNLPGYRWEHALGQGTVTIENGMSVFKRLKSDLAHRLIPSPADDG